PVHVPESALDRGEVVLRQMPRIRARISEDLVSLVKRLRDGQSVAGGESETPIGVALQAREVEQERRELRRGFALLSDRAWPAQALGLDRLGFRLFPKPLRLEIRVRLFVVRRFGELLVEPPARVGAGGAGECPDQLPVG